MKVLKASTVRMHPLTGELAHEVGGLLGDTGTSDVVDGHVTLLAKRIGAQVLTSDPGDIAKLDATLEIIAIWPPRHRPT